MHWPTSPQVIMNVGLLIAQDYHVYNLASQTWGLGLVY